MKTKNVHFTLGENMGLLLTNIAREKILYKFNPEEGINILKDSLMGCSEELPLEILSGKKIITVSEDGLSFIVKDFQKEIHEKLGYREFELNEKLDRDIEQIHENWDEIKIIIKNLSKGISSKARYKISLDLNEIANFLYGDQSILRDHLYDEMDEIRLSLDIIFNYINKSNKIFNVFNYFYNDPIKRSQFNMIKNRKYDETKNNLIRLSSDFYSLISGNSEYLQGIVSDMDEEFEELERYIESSIQISKDLKEGIKPVNILDNWNAGWLSPSGEFYGLNGDISNLLHIQIENALQESGIIPEGENPGIYLEKSGWVKIHGNSVLFVGSIGVEDRRKKPIMTDIQIETIKKYIHVLHGDIIKLGWKRIPLSIGMFSNEALNPEELSKKYFDF